MKVDQDTIIKVTRSFNLSLTEQDVQELSAALEIHAHLIHTLEQFNDVSLIPLLRPPWGLPTDSVISKALCSGHGEKRGVQGIGERISEFSPKEAVEKALKAIKVHPNTNVFIAVFDQPARREAERLETMGKKQRASLPLWGTTVAVKDLISVAGHRMTAGSKTLTRDVPQKNASLVEMLIKAGAIIIGAANLHELAFGATSDNPFFGKVANPLDRQRIAGGSSGGSAAAVGFGMAGIGIGTDTGGSVRNPAACCGIVGLKPSFNLIPMEGILPLTYSLDHAGILTKSVSEAALVLEVLTERIGAYTSDMEGSMRGLRIGVSDAYFIDGLEPEIRMAFEAALEAARGAGAVITPVELKNCHMSPAVYLATAPPEALAIHYRTVVEHGSKMGRDVYIRFLEGIFIPSFVRVKAQQIRTLLSEQIHDAFQYVDVIITPTFPIQVPLTSMPSEAIGQETLRTRAALMRNTCPFNLSGLPAISIPFSYGDGIPVGIQLAGAFGNDGMVLKAARAFEREWFGG